MHESVRNSAIGMDKRTFTLLLCMAWVLTASAQHTVESIRKDYQSVHEWITPMSDNFPSDGIPPEYFDLRVKKFEGPLDYLDIATLKKGTFKDEYTGKTIPEKFVSEADRCKQGTQRYLSLFKSIDNR